jgi:hypothetical protein
MLATFLQLLAQVQAPAEEAHKTAAEEGRDIILSMLVVGLIFVGVAVLGDIYQRGARKRHKQRAGH